MQIYDVCDITLQQVKTHRKTVCFTLSKNGFCILFSTRNYRQYAAWLS